MRYIILNLILFSLISSAEASFFSAEDLTQAEAVAAVHERVKARHSFHKDYIGYLEDQTISQKEKLDLISENFGIERSLMRPEFIGLSLSYLEKDLCHFKRLSSLSSDPRFLTILHLELSFAKKAGLLAAEKRLGMQKKFKEAERKGEAEDVFPYTGFSSEFNDAPFQEESLTYLEPFLTKGHKEFEKKMRSRTTQARLDFSRRVAECIINANDLQYIQAEATDLVVSVISKKLETLEKIPDVGQEKTQKFWEKSQEFFSKVLDCFLQAPVKILELGQNLEALYNQEIFLDLLLKKYLPNPLSAPQPTAALAKRTPVAAAPGPVALDLVSLPETAPETLKSSQVTVPKTAPEAAPLPEEKVSEVHFRQWTQEEKAARAQPSMAGAGAAAAAAAEENGEKEHDLIETIRRLMSKSQLDFFGEVVPQILNPILKKELVMDRNKFNINLFIPYKDTADKRELIYFHAPHHRNAEASHGAFWRRQLKKALTQTGWLQS